MNMFRKAREPPENLQNDLAKRVCVKWPTNLDRKEGQVESESAWAGSKKAQLFPTQPM